MDSALISKKLKSNQWNIGCSTSLEMALPDEIYTNIFEFVKLQDFFGLFTSCKYFLSLSRNPCLWRFWIERDFSAQYQRYLIEINRENLIITKAIENLPKINPLFDKINTILAQLEPYIKEIVELTNENISMPHSFQYFAEDSADYQEDILDDYEYVSSKELSVDLFIDDPLQLYIKFTTEFDVTPCINKLNRYGKIICSKPSMPRKQFCDECIFLGNNLIMQPKIILPFNPVINSIPQLPTITHKLKVESFRGDNLITVGTVPRFVLSKDHVLIGICGENKVLRKADYNETQLARNLGISIAF